MIAVRAGNVIVKIAGEDVHVVRMHQVDELHLYGAVELTSAARNALMRRGIDVAYYDARGKLLGRMSSQLHRSGERRVAQYTASIDPDRTLEITRAIVRGKLLNQRTFLQRILREHDADELVGAASSMRMLVRRLDAVETVDELRGLEGQGAAMYFRAVGAGVRNHDFKFERRSRRPPRDPFNACLSFGYALLASRVTGAVSRAGLDPYVGIFHATSRGKPALVLDLMEEFRCVIDRVTLRLVNLRQLSVNDFEDPGVDVTMLSAPMDDDDVFANDDRPAVYLARTGRAIFVREVNNLWRTRYLDDTSGQRFELGAIIDRQAYLIARAFEQREPYTPWLLK